MGLRTALEGYFGAEKTFDLSLSTMSMGPELRDLEQRVSLGDVSGRCRMPKAAAVKTCQICVHACQRRALLCSAKDSGHDWM